MVKYWHFFATHDAGSANTSSGFGFNDLFPYVDAQNFLARDKELSTFSDHTIGIGLEYDFLKNGTGLLNKGSVNFYLDMIQFDYEDFRDITVVTTPGQEPAYSFDANVIRLFLSLWF